jgi:hypothetical protein
MTASQAGRQPFTSFHAGAKTSPTIGPLAGLAGAAGAVVTPGEAASAFVPKVAPMKLPKMLVRTSLNLSARAIARRRQIVTGR